METDGEEQQELTRRLFALAGRSLERALHHAGRGEAAGLDPVAVRSLAGDLHICGRDLLTLADAIECVAAEAAL